MKSAMSSHKLLVFFSKSVPIPVSLPLFYLRNFKVFKLTVTSNLTQCTQTIFVSCHELRIKDLLALESQGSVN